MGLRRLLTRQPAADPLGRLAELGREASSTAGGYCTAPFAPLKTQDSAAHSCLSHVGKKVELASESAGELSAAKSKKTFEVSRSRSGYVWVSQASS
jgi:hypothetical protein